MEGKVAVVTGGSSGISRALNVALAKAGADTVIAGRNPAQLPEARAEIAQTLRPRT